jgi:signal transduction histidine kinase
VAGERILVIDDSPDIVDMIQTLVLESEGYEVLTATGGEEGLEMILEENPDLVILDERMPRMNGLEVLEALKEKGAEVPVIFCTVHGSEDLVIQAFRLGVRDYVMKPFELDEMKAAVEKALTDVAHLREEQTQIAQLQQQVKQMDEVCKQAERERSKLEAVLQETGEAIIVLDQDQRILLCNGMARIVLDISDRVEGRLAGSIIEHGALKELLTSVDRANRTLRTELVLGDDRTFSAQISLIEDVGYVLLMQDITHFKELDRIKSEFVSTVSHDLRTPLTTIQGYVGLLETVGELNDEQLEFVDRIRVSIADITELISELLDLGRIEAGYDLGMEPLHVESIIAAVVEEAKPQVEAKGLELRWEKRPLPLVRGSPSRLRQVIENLLANAITYTDEGGWVSVELDEDEGHVVVRVADNGIGIPWADQPYVFERFYRVESERPQDVKGAGLGLTIVRSVVEKHGGRVWVESRPGLGSVFTFVLPTME